MIVLKRVSKSFGGIRVLTDVSFGIGPKECVCITGPGGAGKSTLLSLLIGAEDATGGSIEIDGVDLRRVPPEALRLFRRRVGVIYQDGKLLTHRTVAENVALPLEVCGASDALIRTRVPEVLARVGLSERARSLPAGLSAGEKMKAAIARAIVHRPMIILADELTGNLDPVQANAILRLLREIHAEGATIVLATHDPSLVDALQSRVIRLEGGRVVQDSAAHASVPSDEESSPSTRVAHPRRVSKKVRITSIGS